ncbi:hypothetical protein OZL92_20715 [Bacillus sonorensis]|uniref:Uncharacterized protein n=2 Tax=Bacillus sonorensis TaxID=119858 RepID=M5PHH9_9BACI|nr:MULTISPECIES: hypothetical protein [Bacillus subtilis group]ASB87670.1 hypothetical protein S101395_01134 [Bacillus sonorensis]EME76177.1 hypothetical protein BSONL12_04364 [Bacillus sonorensis L12]MCZ0074644.1 hypothetical protein [Bacillus sonorensis]MCZ0093752.1 hypothetical protein [Bacillus sonorensis]PAD61891.1 hypothetical protein CHH92_01840 [Bacillus sonorensis]
MYRLLYPLKWTFAALEWSFDRIVTVAEFLADMFGKASDNFHIRIEVAEQAKRGVRVIYVKRVRRDRG